MNVHSEFKSDYPLNKLLPDSNLDLQILNHLPTAVYVCNLEGYIVFYNQPAVGLWKHSPTLLKDKWGGAKEIRNAANEFLEFHKGPMADAILRGIERENFELIFLRHDDELRHVISNTKLIKNNDGKVIGAINMLNDITDQIANGDSKGRLMAIADTCTDAIISSDLNGIITSWNNAAALLSGVTEAEAIGKSIAFLIPKGSHEEYRNVQRRILDGEKVVKLESIRNHSNGTEIEVALSVSPILDRTGKIIGLSTIARDVTDMQKAMHKESILAAIVNGSDDTILSKTLDGTLTSWNPAAEKMFGYKEKDIIGKHISILIPKERLSEEDHIIKMIKSGNRIEHFETVRLTKSGKEIPISLTISPIFNNSGEIVGASKIARDITHKNKIVKENLRYIKSLESINSIAKNVSKELNINNILQTVLNESTELTGAMYGAFIYQPVDQPGNSQLIYALYGTDKESFERLTAQRNIHPKFFTDNIIRSGDITQDPLYWKLKPFRDLPNQEFTFKSYLSIPVKKTDESVIGAIILAHPEEDIFTIEHEIILVAVAAQAAISIDNARLYEEVKILNEKKDEFIGMASHELKTPLTSISGYLQILNKILQEEKHKYFLNKTMGIVKKLTDLVSDILDISKITAGKLSFCNDTINLKEVLNSTVELMNFSQQTHKIHLTNVENVQTMGDMQRIEQVLINLLSNAVKYSPNNPDIYVSLEKQEQEILIRVQDFGMGISEDKLQHIFSRFYRVESHTHSISGLGIGLYITKEIVHKHGGRIWVESEVEKGSTFFVALPLKTD